MIDNNIERVRDFWEQNPLFTGEQVFDPSNPEKFFSAHDETYYEDVLKGIDFESCFEVPNQEDATLDLGCGIGFWTSLFINKYGVKSLIAADLTASAIEFVKLRAPLATTSIENAESLTFDDCSFDFVNCQGVIHHTPDTQASLNEIYRVLRFGGRASVSVYYKNILLRLAAIYFPFIKVIARVFLKDLGRGRKFGEVGTIDDLIRLYDGAENPIGKAYSKKEILHMVNLSGFKQASVSYYFFPFRFIKFKVPTVLAKLFVWLCPFMIIVNLEK